MRDVIRRVWARLFWRIRERRYRKTMGGKCWWTIRGMKRYYNIGGFGGDWVAVWTDGVCSTGGYSICDECGGRCYGRCQAVRNPNGRKYDLAALRVLGCDV